MAIIWIDAWPSIAYTMEIWEHWPMFGAATFFNATSHWVLSLKYQIVRIATLNLGKLACFTETHFGVLFSVGKVELFTKHDHTQYKLLATAKDPKYSKTPLNYLSFASVNNTEIDFFHNCNSAQYIDTQMATKYTQNGHPLLLNDPNFDAAIDKKNCEWSIEWLVSNNFSFSNFVQGWRADANTTRPPNTSIATSSHWVKSETVNRPDIKCDSHSMHKRREMHTYCCRARPRQIWPRRMSMNSVSANASKSSIFFFFVQLFSFCCSYWRMGEHSSGHSTQEKCWRFATRFRETDSFGPDANEIHHRSCQQ